MTLDDIKNAVGAEEFAAASEKARRVAALTGAGDRADIGSDVPHDVGIAIFEAPVSSAEKVNLLFCAYEELPSYGLLMYAKLNFRNLDPQARDMFWSKVRAILREAENTLSKPLEYALWCDFFEDHETVEEAWRELVGHDPSVQLLERVLEASGPVPYPMKRPLYGKLIADVRWHQWIYRSLLSSAFDFYGSIDCSDALDLLHRLELPPETEHVAKLTEKLASQ